MLGRAHRNQEVLVAQIPRGHATPTEDQIIARDEMSLLAVIPFERCMVMIAHAAGYEMPEIVAATGINMNTAWSRLRQERLDLLAILKRRAARDRR